MQDDIPAALDELTEDQLPTSAVIAHTNLHVLSEQSGVQARRADKLKALELLMKHLGLAAPEQHQHVHQHVHFTPEQLNRMTDEQLDRTEAAYTMLVALEEEVAADDAQRTRFRTRAAESTSWDAAHPRELHCTTGPPAVGSGSTSTA